MRCRERVGKIEKGREHRVSWNETKIRKTNVRTHLSLENLSLCLYLISDTRTVVVVGSQSSLAANGWRNRNEKESQFWNLERSQRECNSRMHLRRVLSLSRSTRSGSSFSSSGSGRSFSNFRFRFRFNVLGRSRSSLFYTGGGTSRGSSRRGSGLFGGSVSGSVLSVCGLFGRFGRS
jgi:hypothetical protein